MRGPALGMLKDTETRRAAGLAAAVMGGNVMGLAFTVVFTHALGGSRYGSLAALLSTYIILMVPGAAVQVAVAREVSTGVASGDPATGASLRRWLRSLLLVTLALVAVSIAARHVIASIIGVGDVPWGAAAALPSGALWLIVCVERGALQGFRRYRAVGASILAEQSLRLAFAAALFAAGAGVTGAYLGTAAALVAVGVALAARLRRELPTGYEGERLRDLLMRARIPVLALALIAWLQDGNVIIVKHLATKGHAGAWAAAAVAAKAIMWIATGLALYVVPEAAKRARLGEDPRGALVRALGLIAALAIPMVLVFTAAAHPLLHAVFKLTAAAGALPWLSLATSTLAFIYIAAQYQLALHRSRFILLLAAAAVTQPFVLVALGTDLTALALGVLAVNVPLAAAMIALASRRTRGSFVPLPAEMPESTAAFTEA
jgi:O-antigen/teichoic acid export membrane protein